MTAMFSKIPWGAIATTVAGVIIGSVAYDAGKTALAKLAAKRAEAKA